jgi:hypothetical protein
VFRNFVQRCDAKQGKAGQIELDQMMIQPDDRYSLGQSRQYGVEVSDAVKSYSA